MAADTKTLGFDEVVEQVLRLPADQRESLRLVLEDSLRRVEDAEGIPDLPGEDVSPQEWNKAWAAEVNRRIEEMENGKVQGVPADEVCARLEAKYRTDAS